MNTNPNEPLGLAHDLLKKTIARYDGKFNIPQDEIFRALLNTRHLIEDALDRLKRQEPRS